MIYKQRTWQQLFTAKSLKISSGKEDINETVKK